MDSIHDFAPEIQQRISNVMKHLEKSGFSRPEVKNAKALLSGMLKRHDVRLCKLSRSLGEQISPKKTWERLNRNLRREGLGARILDANAEKNRREIQSKRFCIIDLSDIQKPCAKKMEGLEQVRDGDKSTKDTNVIGNGYWWLNLVVTDGKGMIPVFSETYGLNHEGREQTSENAKILHAMDKVHKLHPTAVHVLDRGGDRSVILDHCIERGIVFIIRGQAQRSLRLHCDSGKVTNIKKIALRTKTEYSYVSARGEWFDTGIRQVYYGKTPLWLVVSQRRRGGLSWYLTNMAGARRNIIDTVLEGYGLRWRVEEYHRQIKQDYNLEKICLRNYMAIKNMCALVVLAASFCACLPRGLIMKIIAASNLLPRRRIRDIPKYPYYMIVVAVASVLGIACPSHAKTLRQRKRDHFQFVLPLTGF